MEKVTGNSSLAKIAKQILADRGYKSKAQIESFLYPDYQRDLFDPYLLKDMDLAVTRIIEAINQYQQVVVYGDYDIDGLTATTLLVEWLELLGAQVSYYIPDRFEEGYGINLAALKDLKKQGKKLVISVDCGITATREAKWAKENELDLIITDHHTVPKLLPQAIAVINPKRPGDAYPFKELAGVGVAFKLAQALQQRLGSPTEGQEKWLLDLVALGTVCDCVSLTAENRALVKFGLMVLNKTKRLGIKALAQVAALSGDITSYHLGYVLGPRLNAAGRLQNADTSIQLLMSRDF